MKKNFKEKDDFIFLNKERVRLTMLVTTNYYMELNTALISEL